MNENGKRPLVFKRPPGIVRSCDELAVPCGTCVGCVLEDARQWAMRCRDESKMWKDNCFITLTYDDAHLPADRFLSKRVWQLFMKRLRKVAGDGVRFMMCGEYGPQKGRPHYHALIFNYDFPDRKFLRVSPSGENLDTSKILESVWPFGYCSVGNLTWGSASYVCRYVLKKSHTLVEKNHYLDPITGELKPGEFRLMSRRPGIGRSFYEKFKLDMFPSDFRVVDGVKSLPPRYYGNIYCLTEPEKYLRIKEARRKRGLKFRKTWNDALQKWQLVSESSDDRLAVKEEVKLSQIKNLSRSLEGNL